MVTIEAIIERAEDGTYCVYCKNDIFSGAGVSIDDAKADMKDQMEFYKKTAIEKGFKYPLFLDQSCFWLMPVIFSIPERDRMPALT